MSFLAYFRNVDESHKVQAVKRLIEGSTPDYDFFVMLILSVIMASLGLLLDSAAIVIGSMLIAPMLYPVVSLALGVTMADYLLIHRAVCTLGISMAAGIAVAAAASVWHEMPLRSEELLARTEPSLAYFLVACVSGFALAFSLVRPQLSETLPGLAISVALLPPLAAIGIGLASLDVSVATGAASLFAVNVLGIILTSMASFSLLDLHQKKQVAKRTLEKEDKRVAQEKTEAEALASNL